MHIVLGLGLGACEAYPGVLQPFGGYCADCVIRGGQLRPGDAPGLGREQMAQLGP